MYSANFWEAIENKRAARARRDPVLKRRKSRDIFAFQKVSRKTRVEPSPTWRNQGTGVPLPPPIMAARDLKKIEFAPLSWLVRDLLPEGLTLPAGKPMLGKSSFALQLSFAFASGGEVLGRPVEQGRVLYAAREGNLRG